MCAGIPTLAEGSYRSRNGCTSSPFPDILLFAGRIVQAFLKKAIFATEIRSRVGSQYSRGRDTSEGGGHAWAMTVKANPLTSF